MYFIKYINKFMKKSKNAIFCYILKCPLINRHNHLFYFFYQFQIDNILLDNNYGT